MGSESRNLKILIELLSLVNGFNYQQSFIMDEERSMKTVIIRSERLLKIRRFVYAKFYDDFGNVYNSDYINVQDKKGEWEAKQLFWRFYWIINLE